jgi:hypothetical protein
MLNEKLRYWRGVSVWPVRVISYGVLLYSTTGLVRAFGPCFGLSAFPLGQA